MAARNGKTAVHSVSLFKGFHLPHYQRQNSTHRKREHMRIDL